MGQKLSTATSFVYLYRNDDQSSTDGDSHEYSGGQPGGHDVSVSDSGKGHYHKPRRVAYIKPGMFYVRPLQIMKAKHTKQSKQTRISTSCSNNFHKLKQKNCIRRWLNRATESRRDFGKF